MKGDQQLTLQLANGSCVRLRMNIDSKTEMDIVNENAWWQIETDDGAQQLKNLLQCRAKLYLQDLIKRNQFSPQQVEKLRISASLQVARDCRTIHQLKSAFCESKHDNPLKNGNIDNFALGKLMEDSTETLNKVDEILVGGIRRKDSLFYKVLCSQQVAAAIDEN